MPPDIDPSDRTANALARALRRAMAPLVIVWAALPGEPACAGVFNEPAGRGLVIVQGLYDTATRAFDAKGRPRKVSAYTKREGWAYLQYGVTDWLMAIVQPDVVSAGVAGASGGHHSGFGTSMAGAQVRLPNAGPLAFALQGTFHLSAADRSRNPALVGTTSRDTDVRGLVGAVFTLGPWPGFVDAEAGYRLRGARSPDEVHVDLTGGLCPRPDVLLLLQSFTTVPTQAGTPFDPRSDYTNLQGSVVYDLDARWALQVGGFGTVHGRNALLERGVTSAVWYRF